MSSKIYFNDKNRTLAYYLVNIASRVFLTLMPRRAERYLRRIMVTPQKRDVIQAPADFHAEGLETEYGSLSVYEVGSGPVILYVHGWSGAGSQFFDLMETMSKQGYRCLTFDHYAHGASASDESNYPLFIKGLEFIVDKYSMDEKCVCVVSHSMGASASINIFKDSNIPHYLISPVFDLMKQLGEQISRTGVSFALYQRVVSAVERDYSIDLTKYNASEKVRGIRAPMCVVHDPADKFVSFSNSESMQKELNNMSLQAIHNVGHMRIINADETRRGLIDFLSSNSNEAREQ